jgi:uncharacterized protein (DUF302 family)
VYQETTDFLSLIPCNVVIRHLGENNYAIEMIKPSAMMQSLENSKISAMASSMDQQMQQLLNSID